MIIDTERLRIRDWTPADAAVVVDIYGRAEVVKWLGDEDPVPCHDEAQARRWIERWRGRADPPLGYWALEALAGAHTGRTIGSVLLVPLPNNEHDEVEIGWSLHPEVWGNGYASEAGAAILRRGFEAGLPEIHAVTHLTNERSMAVCRRLGMRHTGVVHTWYRVPSEHFVITRSEWARAH